MRITGPESEFMDGYHAAAKDDAAEFKRLDARVERLEAALREIVDFTADARDDDPLSHVHGTASAALREAVNT